MEIRLHRPRLGVVMARRTNKRPGLPSPTEVIATRPELRSITYAGLTRKADALLAKAEEALRSASCVWSDIDSTLEIEFDQLARLVLEQRRSAVEQVRESYGDRLGESAL